MGYRERPGLGSTDTSDYTTEIAESLPESSQTETPDADKSGFLGAEDPTQGVSSLYSSRLAAMKNAFSVSGPQGCHKSHLKTPFFSCLKAVFCVLSLYSSPSDKSIKFFTFIHNKQQIKILAKLFPCQGHSLASN